MGDGAESNGYVPIEETEVFRIFVGVADEAWRVVKRWPPFERDTIGRQLVRSADGVGSNLVEGDGRYSDAEAIQFFRYARGSARESRYWITRATIRGLIPAEQGNDLCSRIVLGARQLNGLIGYRKRGLERRAVREERVPYGQQDPFTREESA